MNTPTRLVPKPSLLHLLRTGNMKDVRQWGKPCFTYQKKNVAIVIPLKDACALSFFKGALLKDPKQILQKIGQGVCSPGSGTSSS